MAFFARKKLASLKERTSAARAVSIIKRYSGTIIGVGDAHTSRVKIIYNAKILMKLPRSYAIISEK